VLAKRVIPTMLVRGRTLVKGKGFTGDRSIGNVMQAATLHATRGVDELCILDIAATKEGRGPDLSMVEELSAGCFIPITVGGGVKTLADIDALLRAGADKIAIGAAAQADHVLVVLAAQRFGSQAIVVSVDVPAGCPLALAVEAAKVNEDAGAGEILLQSIERDGMLCGYDLDLIRAVSEAVDIPVIASGGCGTYEHMHEAIKAGADAVAAGAMFQFTDATPRKAAQYLKAKGVEVRL